MKPEERKRPSYKALGSFGHPDKTERGFEILPFSDCNERPCVLQASSLAVYEKPGTSAVWLSVKEPEVKVLAKHAPSVGVQTTETTGWVDYPLPEGVEVFHRLHLDRAQVRALINHLTAWLETGTFRV